VSGIWGKNIRISIFGESHGKAVRKEELLSSEAKIKNQWIIKKH
jgi:hypothetical protein